MLKLIPFFAEFNMNDRNSVVGAGHGNLSTIDNRPSLLSPSQSGVPEAPDTFAIQTKVTPATVTLPPQVTSDSVDLQPQVTLDSNPHQPQVTLEADPLHHPASHKMNSPSPAKSSVKIPTYKTVPALNFRCKYCSRCFTTDNSFEKHLLNRHQISDYPPVLHYISFMGKRKIKVNLNKEPPQSNGGGFEQSFPKQKEETSRKNTQSFICSMCDKTYVTREGVKRHLKNFHQVTSVTAEHYSSNGQNKTIPSSRTFPKFKTPAIQTKVTPDTVTLPRQVTSDSVDLQPLVTLDLNPHQPQVTLNADPHQPQVTLDSDPLHYPASHKMNSPSPATVNTNSKKRLKAKSNFGICKSITNPFCSGGVRMENFTLWKSNKPKTTPTETTVNIVELEKVPRTTNRPKEKVRKGKRKRSCGIPGCVPCSVVTNCSVCNYCLDKSKK